MFQWELIPRGRQVAREGGSCLLLQPVTPPHSGLRAKGAQVRAPTTPIMQPLGI